MAIFGLILAMFLTSQPYDFDAIAHIGIVRTVFEKIERSRKMAVFVLILAMFLTFQSYDFDASEHTGTPLGVE